MTTWTGADIVGSTSVTRDQNGNVNTQRYKQFGEVRTDGSLATDHTYTGQVFDQSTGLGFYNARYYDPATGRFITPDSIVPNPQDGQDYNRYTYVRNNPIRYNDPTGHETCGTRDNRYVCWDDFELSARSQINPDGSGGTEDLAYSCPYFNCRSFPTADEAANGASLTSTLASVEPSRCYSLQYRIEVDEPAASILEEIVTDLQSSPFPFDSNCGQISIGVTCELQLASPFGGQPVEIVDVDSNSFSFESLPGHVEGEGNRITFGFQDSPAGDLILSIDAFGPYDNFGMSPLAWWGFGRGSAVRRATGVRLVV